MYALNIDDIYESAFIAEKWPIVLGELAKITGAVGGGFFSLKGEAQNWTASTGLMETMEAFMKERVLETMGRPTRVNQIGQHCFVTERDTFKPEELDEHPLYRDFLRPRGLGWSARTSVQLPTDNNIVLTMERALKEGPVPEESMTIINSVRAHLARAAFMSARLRLESAKTATQTLALLGLPALVLNANGQVVAANDLIEALTHDTIFLAHGQFALVDQRANKLLHQAVLAASKNEFAAPFTFSISGADCTAKMVAHVIPVRGQSRDVFVRCAGVLILTPVTSASLPTVDLVQSLFDFTPAEAKIARFIAKGDTVEDIASNNGVSINTVRAQLRSVLEKTGCHRQVEVATLMGNLNVIRT